MSIHLYFSLIPEALIASMLTPEQFGQYYATGHKFKSKGQALFFDTKTGAELKRVDLPVPAGTQVTSIGADVLGRLLLLIFSLKACEKAKSMRPERDTA